jgi:hypothetical protein
MDRLTVDDERTRERDPALLGDLGNHLLLWIGTQFPGKTARRDVHPVSHRPTVSDSQKTCQFNATRADGRPRF